MLQETGTNITDTEMGKPNKIIIDIISTIGIISIISIISIIIIL